MNETFSDRSFLVSHFGDEGLSTIVIFTTIIALRVLSGFLAMSSVHDLLDATGRLGSLLNLRQRFLISLKRKRTRVLPYSKLLVSVIDFVNIFKLPCSMTPFITIFIVTVFSTVSVTAGI